MARVRVDGIGIPDADSYYERIRGESSLVAYFPLTESHYGRVLDTHGGRLGDTTGSPSVADADVPYGGKAMTFDGTNDWITVPFSSALATSTWTFEAWVKFTGTDSGNRLIVDCRDANPALEGFRLQINPANGNLQLTLGDASGQFNDIAGNGTLSDGVFAHIAVTWDGTDVLCYVNGALESTNTPANGYTANTGQDIIIGGKTPGISGSVFPWLGDLAHVAFYNAALTPAKINRHYSAFANAVLNLGPVGYWRLNEASGTTATDLGSGGNDGTYTNTPTLGATGGLQDDPATATSVDGGLDQYVSIADDAALDGDGSFSAGYLFKCNDADATTVFFQKAASALNSSTGWWCGMIDNNRPRIKIADGTDTAFVDNNGGTDLYDNAWHFLMFVNDATNEELSIYVDGAVAKSGNDSLDAYSDIDSIANTEAVEIMRVLGATNPAADATGQDFMFFDRALSAQEIDDLYKLAKNALTPRVLVRS